jgi:hypothetical protein
MLLAGDSAFSARFPTAIAGALAVPVMYKIGTLLFDRSVGLLAALILALCAYHIRYAQEVRAYGLIFWETGKARRVLPEEFTRLYGEATHEEVYAVTDTYNNEVATFPYQGDGTDLLLFKGPGTNRGESK